MTYPPVAAFALAPVSCDIAAMFFVSRRVVTPQILPQPLFRSPPPPPLHTHTHVHTYTHTLLFFRAFPFFLSSVFLFSPPHSFPPSSSPFTHTRTHSLPHAHSFLHTHTLELLFHPTPRTHTSIFKAYLLLFVLRLSRLSASTSTRDVRERALERVPIVSNLGLLKHLSHRILFSHLYKT